MVGRIDVLRQEHKDVARLLGVVDEQINGEAPLDLDLLHEILGYCLTYPDQYHHPKEDLIDRALCEHDQRVEPVVGELDAEISDSTDPLFREESADRLRRLLDRPSVLRLAA